MKLQTIACVFSLKSGAKQSQLVKFRVKLFYLIRISALYKVDIFVENRTGILKWLHNCHIMTNKESKSFLNSTFAPCK
jgi:hypothetical protein